MQKKCSKCRVETNDSGDVHCRRVLIEEVKKLVFLKKLEEVDVLVAQEAFDEEWKQEVLSRFTSELRGQQELLQSQLRRIEFEAKKTALSQKIENSKALSAGDLDWLKNNEPFTSDLLNRKASLKKKYDKILEISIVMRIKNGETLSSSELNWMNKDGYFGLLATYYRKFYIDNKNIWDMISASKYLRKADLPKNAIALTQSIVDVPVADTQAMAAIFTSRGGAWRDLSKYEKAETCAYKAIGLSPAGFQPYNLLGAIQYNKGKFDEGDKFFERATELGAKFLNLDAAGRDILRERARQNPEKYNWLASVYKDEDNV